MRRRQAIIRLVGICAVAVLGLIYTFVSGNKPLLGLDLEGGVSVVLKPIGEANDDQINQAITIMNQRINTLGVAEPDIHREGQNIVVQIAGLKDEDKDKAIDLVGKTAELRFRPVLQALPETATPPNATPTGSTTTAPATPGSSTPAPGTPDSTTAVNPGGANSTTPPTGGNQVGLGVPGGGEGELAAGGGEGESAAGRQTPTTATDQPPAPAQAKANACGSTAPTVTNPDTSKPLTPEEDNKPESACNSVVLGADANTNSRGGRYLLGPACDPVDQAGSCLTGAALAGAQAGLGQTGKWTVNPSFKAGADGIDKFNALAAKCYSGGASCPNLGAGKGQMAITLDGKVLSAPTINSPSFQADRVEISGEFQEESAKSLATALKYGALPVQLEQLSSETVSATLGRDALNAGVAAGLVGLLLVAVYMTAFYRLLGVLAMLKLTVEGALLWTIISYLGTTAGLALTLAGVTGIIVSIGTSLDSNVVYYEHLREDVRSGRTVRSAVERSFGTAMGTILKADGASLLGAVLLYWLAIGPVRGFAFYLGLSTVLDLICSYFYMRPVVFLSASTKLCARRPGLFGLPHEIAAPPPTARTGVSRPSRRGKAPGAPAPARQPARAGAAAATATTVADAPTDRGLAADGDPGIPGDAPASGPEADTDTDPATTEATS